MWERESHSNSSSLSSECDESPRRFKGRAESSTANIDAIVAIATRVLSNSAENAKICSSENNSTLSTCRVSRKRANL